MRNAYIFVVAGFVLVSAAAQARADEPPPFDVPRVDNVTIDGHFDDWGDGGFRVDMLTSVDGRALPKTDLDAAFRLGWMRPSQDRFLGLIRPRPPGVAPQHS